MSNVDLVLIRFLLASCGSIAAGLAVWGLATLCRRYLPAYAAQRSVWLLGQLTVMAAFLVILLPHSERLRVVPPLELPEISQPSAAMPLAAAAGAKPRAPSAQAAPAPARTSPLRYATQAWLLVYLLGLAYAVTRLLLGRRVLLRLAAAGNRLPALAQHAGFSSMTARAEAPPVIEVDLPISPMLFGVLKPRLLLPAQLRAFEPAQQQMIIEHELTHLRRHDLHWTCAAIVLHTLLWFNPFMRLLSSNLCWAQELGCDRAVLRGRPGTQRKAYAAALVAQLRLQHRPGVTALAFGGVNARTLGTRISLIRAPHAAATGSWSRIAGAAGLSLILAASLMLQPALPSPDAAPARIAAWVPAALAAAPLAATAGGDGCTAISDAVSGQQLLSEGGCDERVTPASTFNIVVSLMGYDSGILIDQHTPAMPFKAGYLDYNKSWRATTDPTSWLQNSVVWYAQQVTTKLGAERFQRYITGFNYGNQDLRGDRGEDNGLTSSWIGSSLKISPNEQLAFLRKIVNRELPVSNRAYEMTSDIMVTNVLDNGWVVRGKTGTASALRSDGSEDRKRQLGWFVGWAKKGDRTVVFARMRREERQKDDAAGYRVKRSLLSELPAHLDKL